MLLACLQFLAQTPCPRCYTLKKDVPDLGTTHDYQRRAHVREDTHPLQSTIKRSRELIFEGGYSISSKAIKTILASRSLTPQRVCYPRIRLLIYSLHLRVRSQFGSPNTGSTSTRCSPRTSCMNLSLAYGSQRSLISSEWCIHLAVMELDY